MRFIFLIDRCAASASVCRQPCPPKAAIRGAKTKCPLWATSGYAVVIWWLRPLAQAGRGAQRARVIWALFDRRFSDEEIAAKDGQLRLSIFRRSTRHKRLHRMSIEVANRPFVSGHDRTVELVTTSRRPPDRNCLLPSRQQWR